MYIFYSEFFEVKFSFYLFFESDFSSPVAFLAVSQVLVILSFNLVRAVHQVSNKRTMT